MSQLDGTGMKRLHREWRRRTTGRVALNNKQFGAVAVGGRTIDQLAG